MLRLFRATAGMYEVLHSMLPCLPLTLRFEVLVGSWDGIRRRGTDKKSKHWRPTMLMRYPSFPQLASYARP
ncbi:uncharacterized protein ARMOST_15666 [Armillaria ostoyae]|uniref:Uncharacterized protein n=1 Tax=Armillaria ostoyae TaxID=47428 RepID=A0A284RU15_ARMOS|nr:uncharacterized protein ARMOST_15666 [Armillaria ostoyae]